MTLPPVHLPMSKSVLIGLVALIHITLVSIALAGPLIAVVFEYLGVKKKDQRYDRLANGLIPIVIEATVIGGIFGSAMVVLFLGLYPVLIAAIFNVFFWFLVLQLLAGYLINLLFMALYYLRWDRMAERKGAHMVLGLVAGLAPLLVAIVFTAGVTFMATPGKWVETGNVWHGVFNPTFWPALLHRLLAAVAIVGALIVAKALWKARAAGADVEQRAFEAGKGARLAAWASILQIIPGLWYTFALPQTGRSILFGAALVPWVLGILAGVVSVILFLLYGKSREGSVALGPLWAAIVLVVVAIWFMGWTRSMTRGKDLIAGVMDAQQKLVVTPPAFKIPVSGEAIFSQKCGTCHPGLAGDAISKATKYKTDEELIKFLTDPMAAGVSMPPVRLSDEEMQALIRYLRGGGKGKKASEGAGKKTAEKPRATLGRYVALAWNDLGMHCYDEDESVFCILPPYQTVWTQVIERGTRPEIVTEGLKVHYAFENNTTSQGKTNFWDHAQKLFGSKPAPDVGLKGFGLEGEMEPRGDHFVAEGIPLTAKLDDGTFEPFETVLIGVYAGEKKVFETTAVAPTSPEINCSFCHAPRKGATNAEVREAILKVHDRKFDTHLLENRPVLCASCHASNALGAKGKPGVKSLSEAVHGAHASRMALVKNKIDISCYACHPGPKTRCLRGVMSQQGIVCQDCHGDEATVAKSIAEGRQPWLQEPRCESCHGDTLGPADKMKVTEHVYAAGFNDLYRNRKGHGGVYCAACHGSPHAILPAGLEKYNAPIERLQGQKGPLGECTVCHTEKPESRFRHLALNQ